MVGSKEKQSRPRTLSWSNGNTVITLLALYSRTGSCVASNNAVAHKSANRLQWERIKPAAALELYSSQHAFYGVDGTFVSFILCRNGIQVPRYLLAQRKCVSHNLLV